MDALRQLQLQQGRSNFCLVHVSMVPAVGPPPGEQKTKPTQHSVKELRSLGLTPDFIVCRSKDEARPGLSAALLPLIRPRPSQAPVPVPPPPPPPTRARPRQVSLPTREKIGLMCNVATERVLSLYDVPTIYRVPLEMLSRNMDILISEQLGLTSYRSAADARAPPLATTMASPDGSLRLHRDAAFADAWASMAASMERPAQPVTVALVGKYTQQADSYLSVQVRWLPPHALLLRPPLHLHHHLVLHHHHLYHHHHLLLQFHRHPPLPRLPLRPRRSRRSRTRESRAAKP